MLKIVFEAQQQTQPDTPSSNRHMFNQKNNWDFFCGVNLTNVAISWNFLLIPQNSKKHYHNGVGESLIFD